MRLAVFYSQWRDNNSQKVAELEARVLQLEEQLERVST